MGVIKRDTSMKRPVAFFLRAALLLGVAALVFWLAAPYLTGSGGLSGVSGAAPAQGSPVPSPGQAKGSGAAKAGGRDGQRPVPVVVAKAVRRTVPVELRAVGTVEASATVSVKSRVEGELVAVHFRPGQDVRQGDLLFSIDPKPFEAQLREAEARLERDRALLAKAEDDNRRYEGLRQQDIVSQDQFEQVASNLSALRATVRAEEAAVDSARVQLGYTSIRSPVTGRTGRLLVDAGNMIKANAETPMVVIMQVEPIEVAFSVPEAHLMAIMNGMAGGRLPVEARVAGAPAAEAGDLYFVDNSVDRRTGTIALRARFENRSRALWPGQFVDVTLRLGELKDAVVVPSRAVQDGLDGQQAYVVGQAGTVELRKVATGNVVGGETVILSGVEAGETVVTDGHLRLKPGVPVEARGQESATAADRPGVESAS